MISSIGEYLLWLHQRNEITVTPPFLAALRTGVADATEEAALGLELHQGRPTSKVAKRIDRLARRRLSDSSLLLAHIAENGFTPFNLRVLLGEHFWRLQKAELNSEEHCLYLDVLTALQKAPIKTQLIAGLLIVGAGPQEVGICLGGSLSTAGIVALLRHNQRPREARKVNGSREVNREMRRLAKLLSGKA